MAATVPSPLRDGAGFVRGVTLLGVVALCVGNMAGTSLYTLPASLAGTTGPLGIVAWVLTAAGYALVAVVYAWLGARHPRTGGPYVFARAAFGDGLGFATVWAYWVSTVVGNAAIVTGVVGYVGAFAPALEGSAGLRFAVAQGLVWGLCWLNVRGVRGSRRPECDGASRGRGGRRPGATIGGMAHGPRLVRRRGGL